MKTPNALDQSMVAPYLPRIMLDWPDPVPSYREIDGSLVFVDISGFTKMSERLAKKGKVGAEEVTEILNSTFTRLLAVAYEDGGTLIKFGGDALLLFFPGTNHAERAVHAAGGMRRKLAEIGKGLRSSAGNVTLRMSVGVHTGRFQFFVVGDLHGELILTGPAASRTVEMESTAQAGEILLSADIAAATQERLLGGRKGTGTLLKRMPPPPTLRAEEAPQKTRADLSFYVPAAVRERLSGGAFEPEHRQVTVAFVHFDDTDSLVTNSGCPDVTRRLHELVSSAQHAAEEHGITFLGTDVDHDGGKIILVAGTPKTTGHDEEQMLRALRAIIDAGPPLPVRIGVNRGHVFAGDVGPPYRRTYTVMGDAVNLAARVMAKAEQGQILATPEVLDRSRTLFETRTLEPFLVKGKAQPVVAHVVGAIRGSRSDTATAAHELPLAGRDQEIQTLLSKATGARAGTGELIEIIGAAGMGKSRLLHELRDRTPEFRSIVVSAEQYEAQTPYYVFRSLLRTVLEISPDATPAEAGERLGAVVEELSPDLKPWTPLLAVPIDAIVPGTKEASGLDESFKIRRLHASVAQLLECVLQGPTIIGIEDAHFLDEASNELLRFLVRDLGRRPWVVCVTSRPEARTLRLPSDRAATIIALQPLASSAAADLVRDAARTLALPAHIISALAERGGGHPLFLQELVAASTGGSVDDLPDSVEAVINARFDTLQPADRALLRYASVVGAQFSIDVLRDALGGDSAVLDSVSWGRLGEFLEQDAPERYRFRHMLFRDVAYEALPFRRRQEMHERIGEALEGQEGADPADIAEVLSLHFLRGGRHDKAWSYSVLAGDRARSKFANVQAADFYRRALDAARRHETSAAERGRVFESLGDVSAKAALYDQAADSYRSARRLLGTAAVDEVRLLRKEGGIRIDTGDYRRALSWFARGLHREAASEAVDAERVELRLSYAGTRFRQGKYAECIKWCREALPDAERLHLRSAVAHAYYLLHAALTFLGSPERAKYRGAALPIYEELGDMLGAANTLINLGVDAYFAGEWDEALRVNQRAKEVLEKLGDVIGVADALNNIAEILSDQGRLDEAVKTFAESDAAYRGAKSPYGVALSEINLGRAAARDGRDEDAIRLLESGLQGFTAIQAESWIAEAQGRIAEAHVLAGRPSDALTLVERTLPITERIGGLPALQALLHRIRGYASIQSGDTGAAGEAFAKSLRIAKEARATFEVALTLEARARLGRLCGDGSDPQPAAEARALFEQLGVERTPAVPYRIAT